MKNIDVHLTKDKNKFNVWKDWDHVATIDVGTKRERRLLIKGKTIFTLSELREIIYILELPETYQNFKPGK